MIAKRIRSGRKQSRQMPNKMAKRIVALITYFINANPSLIIEDEGLTALSGYLLDTELSKLGVEVGEKVMAFGSRNLEHQDFVSWNAQMISTALQNTRSKDPFEHIVVSFQRGEVPTEDQLKDAVAEIAELLGAKRNQVIWAAHSNTDNIHIHLCINRIDPETHEAVQLGDGWDQDRLGQACAIIEARQGWKPQVKSTHKANVAGEVWLRSNGKLVRSAAGEQLRKKGDRASELEEWRQQPAIADIMKRMMSATGWEQLHHELAKVDAVIARKGLTGAVVIIGDEEHKASRFGRGFGFGALQDRLGTFEAAAEGEQTSTQFRVHNDQLNNLNRDMRDARADAMTKLKSREDAALAQVRDSRLHDIQRRALEDAIRKETRVAKVALREAFQGRLDQISAARVTELEWRRGKRRQVPMIRPPVILFPVDNVENAVGSPVGYTGRTVADGTQYRHRSSNEPAFTDYRMCMIVHTGIDRDVLAALTLAASRWEVIAVTGSKDFQLQCARLAADYGLKVQGRHIPRRPIEVEVRAIPILATIVMPPRPAFTHHGVPVVAAMKAPATYPFVYTTRAEKSAMQARVEQAGFDVGSTGHVRWDRVNNSFKIVDDDMSAERLAALTSLLAIHMTEAARRSVRADQEREAVAQRAETAKPTAHAVANGGVEFAAFGVKPLAPSAVVPRPVPVLVPVPGVRRESSSQIPIGRNAIPLDKSQEPVVEHQPLIDAWHAVDPTKLLERNFAAFKIMINDDARDATKHLSKAEQDLIKRSAEQHAKRRAGLIAGFGDQRSKEPGQ